MLGTRAANIRRRRAQGGAAMTHLTKADLAQVRTRLQNERQALMQGAQEELRRARTEGYSALAGESPDFADQSTATSMVDYDNAMARRHSMALNQIEAALARLDAGDFGRCADCDDEIARGRIGVFPMAVRCAPCQEHHDRTYAHEGRPSL
jgi:RNA polymerase-binding transcription factor DksA